jgi:hypothetical protein
MSPDCLLALLCYLFPPGATADDRKMVRFDAARALRRYARSPATNVPSPGVITASPSSRST